MRLYELEAKTDNRKNDKRKKLNNYVEPPIPCAAFNLLQRHREALQKQNQRDSEIAD